MERIYTLKKNLCDPIWLWHTNIIESYSRPLVCMSQIGARGGRSAPGKDFWYNSAITLTLDLEKWFKFTAHLLPKETLWVKYEPHWAKGREDMFRTRDLGQKKGQTDIIGRLQTAALMKFWISWTIDHYRPARHFLPLELGYRKSEISPTSVPKIAVIIKAGLPVQGVLDLDLDSKMKLKM